MAKKTQPPALRLVHRVREPDGAYIAWLTYYPNDDGPSHYVPIMALNNGTVYGDWYIPVAGLCRALGIPPEELKEGASDLPILRAEDCVHSPYLLEVLTKLKHIFDPGEGFIPMNADVNLRMLALMHALSKPLSFGTDYAVSPLERQLLKDLYTTQRPGTESSMDSYLKLLNEMVREYKPISTATDTLTALTHTPYACLLNTVHMLSEAGCLPHVLHTLLDVNQSTDARSRAHARGIPVPLPTTAQNLEVGTMSLAFWQSLFPQGLDPRSGHILSMAMEQAAPYAATNNKLYDFGTSLPGIFGGSLTENVNNLEVFCALWLASSFARVEVPETLQANMCVTDSSHADIMAPWAAWSVVVPPGLLPDAEGSSITRIWCIGIKPVAMITSQGRRPSIKDEEHSKALYGLVVNLVREVCMRMMDGSHVKRSTRTARPTDAPKKGAGSNITPDLNYSHFVVGTPIRLGEEHDFRQYVRAVASGRTYKAPTARRLIRGHSKMQAHGPKHSLRKHIHVLAYWKRGTSDEILLRSYKIEEDS